jgi:hypothetical protein
MTVFCAGDLAYSLAHSTNGMKNLSLVPEKDLQVPLIRSRPVDALKSISGYSSLIGILIFSMESTELYTE